MTVKANRPVTYRDKNYKTGEIFDMPDKEAEALIAQGHVSKAIIARESDPPGDDIVEGEDDIVEGEE